MQMIAVYATNQSTVTTEGDLDLAAQLPQTTNHHQNTANLAKLQSAPFEAPTHVFWIRKLGHARCKFWWPLVFMDTGFSLRSSCFLWFIFIVDSLICLLISTWRAHNGIWMCDKDHTCLWYAISESRWLIKVSDYHNNRLTCIFGTLRFTLNVWAWAKIPW